MAKMHDSELKAIVSAEIGSALGQLGGELAGQRAEAMDRYLGRPYGNEVEGRSQVVSSDIMDTVEGILPHLIKLFIAGDEVVRFDPQGPEDEEAAQQATEYVNWIFTRDNPGFLILYSWFKDALLQKNGVVKAWWDTEKRWKRESYFGLSDDAFTLLMKDVEDGDMEVVAHSAYADPAALSDPSAPAGSAQGASPVAPPGILHDVIIRRSEDFGRVCVEAVPPEEFLISREARSVQDARFVGHRRRRTLSDLKAEGYPEEALARIPLSEDHDLAEESTTRNTVEDEDIRGGTSLNRAMQEVWVTECYMRVDYDDDGIAELRKITVAGVGQAYEILDNEEWDSLIPFATTTPIIMPHRWAGLSIADLLNDIQLIRTTVQRMYLDWLYQVVHPMQEVVESQVVEPSELLAAKPGAKVRVTAQGTITPIQVATVGGGVAIQALEYFDQIKENRAGFNRYAQGTDENAINKTATGVVQLQNAAMERVLLIARVFAETGVRELFRLILRVVSQYQEKERVIKLRNQWVPMNPRQWATQFDVTISVGLGTGNKDQEFAKGLQLAQIMGQAVQLQGGPNGPLVTLQNLYNLGKTLQEAAGFKQPNFLFSDPSTQPPPQPKPDPKMVEAQQKLQLQREESQQKMQLEREESANELQLKAIEMMMDAKLEAWKANMESQLKLREMDIKAAQGAYAPQPETPNVD